MADSEEQLCNERDCLTKIIELMISANRKSMGDIERVILIQKIETELIPFLYLRKQ